ncbi:MAG: hypothetical protein BAJALOKI1v1_940001 [Promethearchaeota archaeon]|nr:MAG: hypothetical protein BAJALOKI1v1_940001 [Candidatus Lokiarchaeota archaeon]
MKKTKIIIIFSLLFSTFFLGGLVIIQLGAQNRSNVIFYDLNSPNLEISAINYDNITVISDGYDGEWWNNYSSSYSDIVADSNGNIHVVWQDGTPGKWGVGYNQSDPNKRDEEIMYANKTIGSSWSNATVLSDGYANQWGWNDEFSVNADIVSDSQCNLHVVWQDYTPGEWGTDGEIFYVNRTLSGWSNITVVSDGYEGSWEQNTGESSSPRIAIDNADTLHVVWYDNSDGDWSYDNDDYEIMYVNKTIPWSEFTVISDGYDGEWWNTEWSSLPAIATDNSGNIHIVWTEETQGEWGDDDEILYTKITKITTLSPTSPSIFLPPIIVEEDDSLIPILTIGGIVAIIGIIGVIIIIVIRKRS